jgi:hypothetical protein
LYIGIQFCGVSKIFKNPSDPYDAVLQNLGAYKWLFSYTNNNKGTIITATQPPTFRRSKMDLLAPSDLPLDVITTIIDHFKHLSMVAMYDVFGKMPYE